MCVCVHGMSRHISDIRYESYTCEWLVNSVDLNSSLSRGTRDVLKDGLLAWKVRRCSARPHGASPRHQPVNALITAVTAQCSGGPASHARRSGATADSLAGRFETVPRINSWPPDDGNDILPAHNNATSEDRVFAV